MMIYGTAAEPFYKLTKCRNQTSFDINCDLHLSSSSCYAYAQIRLSPQASTCAYILVITQEQAVAV